MLGYEPGETIGRNVFELVHPDDQVGALEGFESTVELGRLPAPPDARAAQAGGRFVAPGRDHRYQLPRRREHPRVAAERPRCRAEHAHRGGAPRERGAPPPDRRARARRRVDGRRRRTTRPSPTARWRRCSTARSPEMHDGVDVRLHGRRVEGRRLAADGIVATRGSRKSTTSGSRPSRAARSGPA